MPGFLLAVNTQQSALNKAVSLLHFDHRYSCITILEKNSLFLATNSYQEYPMEIFEFGDTIVLFEGIIYNKSPESIREFLISLISEEGFNQQLIEPWLATTDGEFVVVLYNKQSSKILIFNDIFGRLPVYYAVQNKTFVISREISFVKAMISNLEYDRFAIASTLLFGYVPGYKTLWKGIYRLPYNSVVLFDIEENKFTIDEGERITIQNDGDNCGKNPEEKLFELLVKGTINRINCLSKPSLALSGGLDSRLIAGILVNNKLKANYLTYNEKGGSADADLIAVDQIVKLLKIEEHHKIIELGSTDETSMEVLLNMKQGLNYLGMAFLIPFLNYFRDNDLQQITGDGGDKILADLRPAIPLRNECDFLKYLVAKNALMPLDKVLKMVSLSKNDFFTELIHIVNTYRAITYEEKYALFLLQERAMVWLFEGEDRNRYFAWITTPFYSTEFALKALSLPMKSKKHGKLFLTFFKKLESGLETIPNPNWKLAPDQQLLIRWLFLKQRIKFSLPISFYKASKLKVKASSEIESIISEIRIEMEKLKEVKPDWFHFEVIDDELLRHEEFNWYLRTIIELWKKSHII
ncbi:MAG: hypothetical protein HOO86_07750 [Bacteroidales bacterium]|nr:hypothetical protein [Bacteroidales bacterium]